MLPTRQDLCNMNFVKSKLRQEEGTARKMYKSIYIFYVKELTNNMIRLWLTELKINTPTLNLK